MEKFCSKCGKKLDKKTGKCPNCDKETITPGEAGKKTSAKKEKKKDKKIVITAIVMLTAIIVIFGEVCFLVYSGRLDIPYINNIFVAVGLKNENSSEVLQKGEKNNSKNKKDDENIDLGSNYEVPAFDAEKYFSENTKLESADSAKSSQKVSTESEAYNRFGERGFDQSPITYEYTMEGEYSDAQEISLYSSDRHPVYQTFYTAANGNVWMIMEVNGDFFASPISYNFNSKAQKQVIISETNTVTSYDSATNKFYVNIPDKAKTAVKTVERIDAKTIENLTDEEIDRL